MSFFPGKDPAPGDARASDAIEQIIVPRSVDLGGITVHRALPSARSRMVGPFIFFDHFGPAVFRAGDGIDVRPHPHIGLATVTYLFDGEIVHRDSLGSAMPIRPGAVNWMTAGRGIVHSERTAADRRDGGEPRKTVRITTHCVRQKVVARSCQRHALSCFEDLHAGRGKRKNLARNACGIHIAEAH